MRIGYRRVSSHSTRTLRSSLIHHSHSTYHPGVHYIPVKADLTDLYDIMTFFRGSSPAAHDGHDDLAKEIASEGKKWSMEYWRKEDIISYMFRWVLLLAKA